jgi:hypothetical protein
MHRRWSIRGGGRALEAEAEHWRQRQSIGGRGTVLEAEVATCIRRAWRWMELMELMEPVVNTKCQRWSKQSELVRTH